MEGSVAFLLTRMADVSAAAQTMQVFVTPLLVTLGAIASLGVTFFLVNGGYLYMTSAGKPDRLEHAKKVIRNALIGLVIIIAAGTLTAILSHAYASSGAAAPDKFPTLTTIQPAPASTGLVDVLIKAITGLLQNIIQSVATPFLAALTFFTSGTPLMGDNSAVFNLWLAIVGMADVLFVLVVAMLGFHIMSYDTFGLDELEFKHLLPQLGLIFLLLNTSIFAIDAIIGLSNAMIHALYAGFPTTSVWSALSAVAGQSGGLGLAALLIMVVFVILAIILLVYYVGRLVTLYIGAVLSPLIFLLWLLPSFKDFATNAMKTYLTTIFVLFVHVVILLLAASIFAGLVINSPTHTPDTLMALVVGLATVIALLKTQGVLMQLSYASIGPKSARRLGSQFVTGVSYLGAKSSKTASRVTSVSKSRSSYVNNATSPDKASPRQSTKPSVSYATGSTKVAPDTSKTPKTAADTTKSTKTSEADKVRKEGK